MNPENKIKAMKAVYCYFFPEVRSIIKEVGSRIPDEMFLVSADAQDIESKLYPLFSPKLEIPSTDGKIDLDSIHLPIIKRISEIYEPIVPGLENFAHSYPTSGSSEGLFHFLVQLKTKGVESISVLKGEYEGYEVQAANIGLNVKRRGLEEALGCKGEHWFISNPSARDGNILPDEFIKQLCDNENRLIVDLAYVGATRPHAFEIGHENIIGTVMSFSKPYGVFRFRIGGFAFSRVEVPSLYGNKWFKDVPALFTALKIAEDIDPQRLYGVYRPKQERIVSGINSEFSLGIRPSDSLLLGYLDEWQANSLPRERKKMIEPFKRDTGYRFCLTPYYEELELNPEQGKEGKR